MINVDVMGDASEIVHYDNPKLPLYMKYGRLSYYPDMKALCHWHEDVELICVIEGEMNYDVNGKKTLLLPGESIVINSRQMHYGYSNGGADCYFSCILFHPSLLMINAFTTAKYLSPILESAKLEYLHFARGETGTEALAAWQEQIMLQGGEGGDYEFGAVARLFELWRLVYGRALYSCDIKK